MTRDKTSRCPLGYQGHRSMPQLTRRRNDTITDNRSETDTSASTTSTERRASTRASTRALQNVERARAQLTGAGGREQRVERERVLRVGFATELAECQIRKDRRARKRSYLIEKLWREPAKLSVVR